MGNLMVQGTGISPPILNNSSMSKYWPLVRFLVWKGMVDTPEVVTQKGVEFWKAMFRSTPWMSPQILICSCCAANIIQITMAPAELAQKLYADKTHHGQLYWLHIAFLAKDLHKCCNTKTEKPWGKAQNCKFCGWTPQWECFSIADLNIMVVFQNLKLQIFTKILFQIRSIFSHPSNPSPLVIPIDGESSEVRTSQLQLLFWKYLRLCISNRFQP